MFELLQPKYDRAIDIHSQPITEKIDDRDTSDEADPESEIESGLDGLYGAAGPRPTQATFDVRAFEPLCEHLACAYVQSLLDSSDELIQSVLAVEQSDLSAEDPPTVDRVFAKTFVDLLANGSNPEFEREYWERITAFWAERLEETASPIPPALGRYSEVLANAPPTVSLDSIVDLLVETAPVMTDTRYTRHVLEFLAAEVEEGNDKAARNAMTVLVALVDHAGESYRFTAPDERWTVVTQAATIGDDRALQVADQFFEQGESEYKQVIERHKTESDHR